MSRIVKVGFSAMIPPTWKVAITEAAEEQGISQAALLELWLSASPPAAEHHAAVIARASRRRGRRAGAQ